MARRKRKHLPQVEKEPEAIFTPQEEKELIELLAVIKYPPYELKRVSNGIFGGCWEASGSSTNTASKSSANIFPREGADIFLDFLTIPQ